MDAFLLGHSVQLGPIAQYCYYPGKSEWPSYTFKLYVTAINKPFQALFYLKWCGWYFVTGDGLKITPKVIRNLKKKKKIKLKVIAHDMNVVLDLYFIWFLSVASFTDPRSDHRKRHCQSLHYPSSVTISSYLCILPTIFSGHNQTSQTPWWSQ